MNEMTSNVEIPAGAGIFLSKLTNDCGGSNRNDGDTKSLLITTTCSL